MTSDHPTAAPSGGTTNEQNNEGGIGGTVRKAAEKLGAQAAEAGDQVYRQAAEAGRYAGRQVEEQPLTALMAAGGLGMLIGFLLGRSSVREARSLRDRAEEYLPRQYRR